MKVRHEGNGRRARERGSAVIILLMLLGIMVMYIAGNAAALYQLKREILIAEKKQERARVERIKRIAQARSVNREKPSEHGQNPHD